MTMTEPESFDYKSAGVDLDTYGETMAQLPPLLKRTYTPRVLDWPGGFAGLFRLDDARGLGDASRRFSAVAFCSLPVMIAMLCTLASFAAAQDQPAPKWELYGGYSFFYPNTDVHGQLPGAVLPLSSRLESNPRGAGASATYNFNRWFGLTLDASTNWGSGEKGLANRIDDAAFSNISFGPKITYRTRHFSPFFEVLVGDHRL